MAVVSAVATVTAYDPDGKEVQCDSRQYASLKKHGYSLTKPKAPQLKPETKPAAKPAAKK